MTEFKIANIVGLVNYHREIDLSALAETFKHRSEISSVTYDPSENHWLQTRFAPNDTYVPFYRSGKCAIVGAESQQNLEKIVGRVNSLMQELLDLNQEPTVEIKNIVATAELDSLPRLETVAIGLGLERTEYEPEQFPAIIYHGGDYVALIFSSGKLVCTGLVDTERISSAIGNITEKIESVSNMD